MGWQAYRAGGRRGIGKCLSLRQYICRRYASIVVLTSCKGGEGHEGHRRRADLIVIAANITFIVARAGVNCNQRAENVDGVSLKRWRQQRKICTAVVVEIEINVMISNTIP